MSRVIEDWRIVVFLSIERGGGIRLLLEQVHAVTLGRWLVLPDPNFNLNSFYINKRLAKFSEASSN